MVKRILVLDGGGVKGIIILKILQQLELNKKIKIADYFDMFAGTSTGALIAVLFAYCKYTASEILEKVYTLENIQKIMYQGYYNWALSTFQIRAKYDDVEKINFIRQFLGENFANIGIYHIEKPMLITAYSPVQKVPILFRNYFDKPNYSLEEVCNATTAAPTYFPIAKVKHLTTSESHEQTNEGMIHTEHPLISNDNSVLLGNSTIEPVNSNQSITTTINSSFNLDNIKTVKEDCSQAVLKSIKKDASDFFWAIDGGVFSNNPSDLIYLDAMELYPNEKFKILSIGTGMTKSNLQKITNQSMGGWDWMIDDNIIDLILDSNQVASHIKTKKLTNQRGDEYLRINEYLLFASTKMDDTSEKNYQKLKDEGDLWWRLYENTDFMRNL